MKHYKETTLAISEITDEKHLVQLFELILSKVTIGSIQEIADLENKSYNGIKKSKRYHKVIIGGKKLAVVGVRQNELPF
jgi:hypothetical protein